MVRGKHSKAVAPGVAKSTLLMSGATLLSRFTGLFRTWAMAFTLGNSMLSSAYQVANNMPNVIFDLVVGGLLSAAFVPVFVLEKEHHGNRAGDSFASNMLNIMALALGALSLLAVLFAPQVIATQTFTVADTTAVNQYAVRLFRIFAIQLFFYGISGIVNGILNAERVYFLPALAPALNNIVVIVAFFLYNALVGSDPEFALDLLAIGTTLGVALQAIIQIPALLNTGFKYRFFLNFKDPALMEALKIAIPTCIYIVGTLVSYSCRNAFSLQVGEECPSTLAYAWTWFQLPYGVICVSLSRTMFTEMSEDAAKKNWVKLRRDVSRGIRVTLLLIMPLAAMMGVFSTSIMQLFQAGRFDARAVSDVAQILMLWCVSLPFYSVWMYLFNVFASLRRFGRFALVSCVMVVVQCLMYWLLCRPDTLGLNGIPLADFVYYAICCVVMLILLENIIGSYGMPQIIVGLLKVSGACVLGVVLAVLLLNIFPAFDGGILQGFMALLFCGSISLIFTFVVCGVLKVPEMDEVNRLVKRLTSKISSKIPRNK